jgi:hypothetical protein
MHAKDESHNDIDGLLFDTFRNVVETKALYEHVYFMGHVNLCP